MSDAYRTDGMMIVPSGDGPKIENALESIACAIAFDVKDWSTSRRDAWIYAIVFGWDEAEESVAWRHQWDAEDIERAHRLHKQWQQVSDLIDSQQLASSIPRWIPVTERLPEEPYGCLLVVWDSPQNGGDDFLNYLPYFAGWDGEQWNGADGEQVPFEVVYWMPLQPLPEPPKENA